MLTDDEIRDAWQAFAPASQGTGWQKWEASYAELVGRFAGMGEGELRGEAAQRALWGAIGAGSIGQGENIDVTGALTDPDVVDRFAHLRGGQLPSSGEQRALAIQAVADEIIRDVAAKHLKTAHKPLAKLHRALAVLLPDDVHCAYSWPANDRVTRLLLGKRRGLGTVAARVLASARLREVLGEPTTLADKVRRSTFCWWLHEQFDKLPLQNASAPTQVQLPLEVEPIEPWPFAKQLKGIYPIKGLANSFRELVRATTEGIPREDLLVVLKSEPEYESLSVDLWRRVLASVQTLGLVETRDDRYTATAAGEELLDTGDFDVLIERLLERVYGFAQLLRALAGPTPQPDVLAALCSGYPQWTTERVPSSLLHWCRHLGLVTRLDKRAFALTEDGHLWHSRLPARLPGPEDVSTGGEEEDEDQPPDNTEPLKLQVATLAQMRTALDDSPYLFDPLELRALHLAWHALEHKRFVLLTGLSGTGKTQLLRQYARAYCATLGLPPEHHVAVVAVGPDWRDPAALLGYFNALHEQPTFHREPATTLLLAAHADPGRPYFLLLDEMNLARPEHFFAPLLASMETGEPIRLHGEDGPINGVRASVPWPRNLFVGGTVNVDETTHPFSDKVLDRAFTLEFWGADLGGFFERRAARDLATEALLRELYDALEPIRRHFGYRTAEEVLRFVAAARDAELPTDEALDQAVAAKILPHVRGEAADGTLDALSRLTTILEPARYPRSARKVAAMRKQLERTGITGFF